MTEAIWIAGIYGGVCALLLVVRSIDFQPDNLTPFELRRRLAAGDSAAREAEFRRRQLPRAIALQRLSEVLIIAALAAIVITQYGWALGALGVFVTLLVIDITSRWPPLRRAINNFYQKHETWVLGLVASWGWLDLMRVPAVASHDVALGSKSELIDLIARSHDILTGDERQHLHKTLIFSGIAVRDIMTPRSMIKSIDADEVLGPLVLDQLHKLGHSRIPVVKGDVDHIQGILYIRDLVLISKVAQHRTIADAMRPEVFYIHEDKHLEHALHAFLRTHHHLCIVVNEFRETVGILSLEDVIEALLGRQVVDEFDEFENIRTVAASNPHSNNQPKGKTDL